MVSIPYFHLKCDAYSIVQKTENKLFWSFFFFQLRRTDVVCSFVLGFLMLSFYYMERLFSSLFPHFHLWATQGEGDLHLKTGFLNPRRCSTWSKIQITGFIRVNRINLIFFRNQNNIVFIKKITSQQVETEFLTESPDQPAWSAGFFTSFIFFKPNPIPVPDQPDPKLTRQAKLDFKTMLENQDSMPLYWGRLEPLLLQSLPHGTQKGSAVIRQLHYLTSFLTQRHKSISFFPTILLLLQILALSVSNLGNLKSC